MLLPESDHEREPPLPQNLSKILLGFAERLDRKCIQWSELNQLLISSWPLSASWHRRAATAAASQTDDVFHTC